MPTAALLTPSPPDMACKADDDSVYSCDGLQKENDDLRKENAELKRELASLRASHRPLASRPSIAKWLASNAAASSKEKSFMRPTRASQLRKVSATPQPSNTAGTTPNHGNFHFNSSPAIPYHDNHWQSHTEPRHHSDNANANGEHQRGYMQPTAASDRKRGSQRAVSTPQVKHEMQQQQHQVARLRKVTARLDDSLWDRLQKRTEQPVAKTGAGRASSLGEQQPLPPSPLTGNGTPASHSGSAWTEELHTVLPGESDL